MKSATSKPLHHSSRWFVPLYLKVLLVFLLNVLVVTVGIFWLLRSVFELDRHLLVDRAARERLQTLGETIRREVSALPEAKWDALLKQHGEAQHAELALFTHESIRRAGAAWKLPEKIADTFPKPGPHPRAAPPPPRFEEEGDDDGPPRPPRNNGTNLEQAPRIYNLEAMQAEDACWFIVRLPPIRRAGPPEQALVLVGRVASLGASPLLFNPMPWYLAGLGVLLVSALLWFPFIRSLTNALAQMKNATAQIAHGNFTTFVNEARSDELGQLGASINLMSERLAGFVNGQKRFLGDIAHELCSPLARLEMALGILEQKVPDALHPRLTDAREEVREMSELVSELLSYAKAGFSGVNALREVVSLGSVVESAIAREAPGAAVHVDLLELTEVVAVPSLLGRALGNLLRNAVRYAGKCGAIEITAHRTAETVEISVADQGPGVPEADLPRLFDPFFRSDPSRTRETGGVGLGLAIVKACIDACGGRVSAANQPDGGLVVTISLQAVPE